jgi:SnoaL-like domain
MGDQREDLARRFLERLADLDADAAASMVSPDYEGRGTSELPISGRERVYRGRDGLRAWIAETAETAGRYQLAHLRFRDYGDALLVVGANRVIGVKSPFGSADDRWTFVCVMRFDGDLIKSLNAYGSYEEAIVAEGLDGPDVR